MFVTMLFLSQLIWADYCPDYFYESDQALMAYEFLTLIDQNQRFTNCDVEVVLCEKSRQQRGDFETPVAQVYIQDDRGREAYLPITFMSGVEGIESDSIVNERILHYEKRDLNYEAELGRTEYYRFEIRKKWGSDTDVERVELGVYSTNTQLNHASGNDSHWYICE